MTLLLIISNKFISDLLQENMGSLICNIDACEMGVVNVSGSDVGAHDVVGVDPSCLACHRFSYSRSAISHSHRLYITSAAIMAELGALLKTW